MATPASANVAIPAWQASAAQQQDGDARARSLTEPHIEIEQRVEAKFAQQGAVTGFGGNMSRAAMLHDAWVKTRERNDGRGRDEAVEQHGNLMAPRREDRARDRGEFAPAQRRRHAKRIA